MTQPHTMQVIAKVHTPFAEKFGIPRQSGLVPSLQATLVFEPNFRSPESIRGLDGFSHLWLLWQFSQTVQTRWSPTVRPPRLGGNQRMGVFATRSPFRPNPIGLSCVRLDAIVRHPQWGHILQISGADLMDQTPIYDIKPYLPYADCHPEALGGFTQNQGRPPLQVHLPPQLPEDLTPELLQTIQDVLAQDPRPGYQNQPDRLYAMDFGPYTLKFTVDGAQLILHQIQRRPPHP